MDCNGKLGLDVVCAGVDARIAAGVHRYKDLRFVSGHRRLSSIPGGAGHLPRPLPSPDQSVPTAWTGRSGRPPSCASATAGTTAAASCPWPDAMPDDGVLDVLAGGGGQPPHLSSAWWASTPRGSTGSTPNLSPTGTASPSPFPPPGRSPWWWTARSCAGPASPSASPP